MSGEPVAVVGGGPGGALLAYLLARAGVAVTLFESRSDFEREYRGDSLHPYTMELLDRLGLADEVLELPHRKAAAFRFHTPHGVITAAGYARLPTRFNYVAIMPQALLIDLLVRRAGEYPGFRLRTSTKVIGLLTGPDGRVRGVRYRDGGAGGGGEGELATSLVVGADGRHSTVRRLADIPITSLGATTDLIWFRLPRRPQDPPDADLDLYCGPGRYVGMLGSDDHWRIGLGIPRGGYAAARQAGVGVVQDFLRTHVPWLADRAGLLTDFTQTSLLSVDIAAVARWHRPGLLLIGDAAHVISPVGGNGILMAVQDAVSTANVLVPVLRRGEPADADLARVEAQRVPAIAEVQAAQVRTERSLARARERNRLAAPPRFLRPILALPVVQRRSARSNAYGPRAPELDLAVLDASAPGAGQPAARRG
ncbi:FAD-dependent oxidoreductase [Pseudonocardia humida]|uniref:FAD-dependent oxidoreductase n=1 Tax=Pseudonocardia humida TaxID=2800819 RepID=A0ABT1AAN7_9PSEU|nr:FAD-dependent monooxygenase [Pseudonocardia humida]MCO1660100.1 FAD-dependent oxidoreductase [Pseudonocardia humida]